MGKNVVILGASGYTGAELVRLIAGHPDINIVAEQRQLLLAYKEYYESEESETTE